MKYTNSEAMNEVLARRDQLRRKRERRRTAGYSLSVCMILVVLTLTSLRYGAGVGAHGSGADQSGAEAMGSFLLEAKTGGILAALILAFILGVLAALFFTRRRRMFPKSERKPEAPEAAKNNENGGTSK